MIDFTKLTHIIIDVDGTMTDSGLYFDGEGKEIKRFSSRDFVGAMAAHYIGMEILIVTGRESKATEMRAEELKVDYLYQHVKNKKEFINNFMLENGICPENLGYIGDDLNDYGAMKTFAEFKACPADACPEIKNIADYISVFKGGTGVVQDVMRHVLKQLGRWDDFIHDEVEGGY